MLAPERQQKNDEIKKGDSFKESPPTSIKKEADRYTLFVWTLPMDYVPVCDGFSQCLHQQLVLGTHT